MLDRSSPTGVRKGDMEMERDKEIFYFLSPHLKYLPIFPFLHELNGAFYGGLRSSPTGVRKVDMEMERDEEIFYFLSPHLKYLPISLSYTS